MSVQMLWNDLTKLGGILQLAANAAWHTFFPLPGQSFHFLFLMAKLSYPVRFFSLYILIVKAYVCFCCVLIALCGWEGVRIF